jgi:glycosyltransferase involved in cell wall biosynthesis
MLVKKYISKKNKNIKFIVPKALIKKNNDIELSIVVPTYNEKKTIKQFVEWCKEGISSINLKHKSEIIIIDSSNDGTDKIAFENGAKVVKTPLRGLGQAYLDAMEFVSGKYMILGDADCTYDFRNLKDFYTKFKRKFEFIMGSRRKGNIERRSMPNLHRYFGIPITNFLLNFIYGSKFSDIHCGMRGITKKAFLKMNLNSEKWGYASEMLIKAIRLKLKTSETPINFYVAPNNRKSIHVREGWLSPWRAGIQNIDQMLTFGSDFIFKKLFYLFFSLSFFYFFVTIIFKNDFLVKNFQFHWSFFFFTLLILSYLLSFFSDVMNISYQVGLKKNNFKELVKKKIRYNFFHLITPVLGIIFMLPSLKAYLDPRIMEINMSRSNLFLVGISFIVLSVIKFFEYFYYKGLSNILFEKKNISKV